MAGNIATLKPITPGDPRGGRKPGQVNAVTKVLKHAILLAGEQSRHSKDGSLLSYLVHVADEFPALYISLLGRLVPVEAKIKNEFNYHDLRLNPGMDLATMISTFERKIKDVNYHPMPRAIEHDADDDGDDE